MKVSVSGKGDWRRLVFEGPLDGDIGTEEEQAVRSEIAPKRVFYWDVKGLTTITPAGMRWLRLLFQEIHQAGGRVHPVDADRKWVDVLDATGFLHLSVPLPMEGDEGVDPDRPLAEQRVDLAPTRYCGDYGLRPGVPFLTGAWPVQGGISFSVYSRHATECTLVLFERGSAKPTAEILFPPEFRTGHVFAMTVVGLKAEGLEYGYRMKGPYAPKVGHRFDHEKILLDPYARGVGGQEEWGEARDGASVFPFRGFIPPGDFEWEGDRPLEIPMQDLVIYEMHVRGFTKHPSSGVRFPGCYAGIREKIPYLKELGVNAVELMPIFEFDECENGRTNPATGERLFNYWGYSTIAFWAPKAAYAATGPLRMQTDEFKALVKELHRNGIEVILDVVFNHTAEGNEHGPTYSFRGIDNQTYYMLNREGYYLNFSGCGNTVNCNNPSVRYFIVSCLRYWVSEYHVDGFRFDLASILGRDPWGAPMSNPPLLEALAMDPVLGKTKLIAEAWDAGGLYQVGTFPDYGRWAEWNGKFRDCARKFLKGDPGQVGEFAQRLVGSPDLYSDTGPTASVNFITAHDGYTLADLVSYNDKHNEANGEENRDGANDNYSWNCGIEGETDDVDVVTLRRRQMKNAICALLLSQGVPMILMGDELGHTQKGNNNTYCQDNDLTRMDWSRIAQAGDHLRFCKMMVAFRAAHPALRFPAHPGQVAPDESFLEVNWHGTEAWRADWSPASRAVAATVRRYGGGQPDDLIYVAFNMNWKTESFGLPGLPEDQRWHVAVNTGMDSPDDIYEVGREPELSDQGYVLLGGRSVMVLVAKEKDEV